jgi:hypothetical protein
MQNSLVQKIQFYRQLQFFADYGHLSDEALMDRWLYWRVLQDQDPSRSLAELDHQLATQGVDAELEEGVKAMDCDDVCDVDMIGLDDRRVITIGTDVLFGEEPPPYCFETLQATFQQLVTISRDQFSPEPIHEICEGLICLQWQSQEYHLAIAGACDDPISLSLQLNLILQSTPYQFYHFNLAPDVLIILLSEDEKEVLTTTLDCSLHEGNWLLSEGFMEEPCYQGRSGKITAISSQTATIQLDQVEPNRDISEIEVPLNSISQLLLDRTRPDREIAVDLILQSHHFSPSLLGQPRISTKAIAQGERHSCIAVFLKGDRPIHSLPV